MPGGNPNHDPKTGEFSSGSGGGILVASGHNAGGGNRAVAEHVASQHVVQSRVGALGTGVLKGVGFGSVAGGVVGGIAGALAGSVALAANPFMVLVTNPVHLGILGAIEGVKLGAAYGGVIGGAVGLATRKTAIQTHIAAQHAADTGRS